MSSVASRVLWIQACATAASVVTCYVMAASMGSTSPTSLAMALGAAGITSLLISAVVLRTLWNRWWTLPRDGLVHHIEAIGVGKLEEQIEPELDEWRPLARSLNVMVARLRSDVRLRQQALDELTDEVSFDPLTRLPSRTQFIESLGQALQLQPYTPIAVLILRVVDLADINHREGRDVGDELLRSVSAVLRARYGTVRARSSMAARLNGADFGVVVCGSPPDELNEFVESLHRASRRLHAQALSPLETPVVIGCAWVPQPVAPGEALAMADAVLRECESTSAGWRIGWSGAAQSLRTTSEWRTLLDDALRTGHVRLITRRPQEVSSTEAHELAELEVLSEAGSVYGSVEVTAAALRTHRLHELDLRLVELAIAAAQTRDRPLVIRLRGGSCNRPSFVRRLMIALEAQPGEGQLWFEFDFECGAVTVEHFAPVATYLRGRGVRLGAADLAPGVDPAVLAGLGCSYIRTPNGLERLSTASSAVQPEARSPSTAAIAKPVRAVL